MFKKTEMNLSLSSLLTICFTASKTLKIDFIVWKKVIIMSIPPSSHFCWCDWCIVRRIEEGDSDFPVVKMSCFVLAVLALESFFTPAHTANLSSFNEPASSLMIFCFLSLTGFTYFPSVTHLSSSTLSTCSAPPNAPTCLFFQISISTQISQPCKRRKWSWLTVTRRPSTFTAVDRAQSCTTMLKGWTSFSMCVHYPHMTQPS